MTNQVATAGDNAAQAFQQELDAYTPNLEQALPAHVSVEKFKRVLTTAVGMNPDLYYANRRTFFTAAVRCAADGLLPDGREAALVVYNTRMKRRDPNTGLDREVTVPAVTYMPMVAGIRKRMRNSGDVLSATAEVVYRGDKFKYRLGDDAMIEHEPPQLGEERGPPVGAYAIIRLRSGEVLRDVMPMAEIEAARKQSRAQNSLMWTKFWSEGAKKTVLRRCAKAAPQTAEIDALLSREEEPPLLPDHSDRLPAIPPAPRREDFEDLDELPAQPETEFEIIDPDGAVRTFSHGEAALDALTQVVQEAARLGRDRLAGCWDDNQASLEELERNGISVESVVELYASLSSPPARERPRQDVQQPAAPSPPVADAAGSRRVPRDIPPTQAAASPAMSQGSMDDYYEQTGEVGQSSPDGPGPTAPTPASRSETHPLTGDTVVISTETGRIERVEEAPREPQVLDMVMTGGRPNLQTWTRARLIPRMRRQQTSDDLAWFLGDNDENIEQAKRHPDLRREIEEAAAAQWRVIGELEAQR